MIANKYKMVSYILCHEPNGCKCKFIQEEYLVATRDAKKTIKSNLDTWFDSYIALRRVEYNENIFRFLIKLK